MSSCCSTQLTDSVCFLFSLFTLFSSFLHHPLIHASSLWTPWQPQHHILFQEYKSFTPFASKKMKNNYNKGREIIDWDSERKFLIILDQKSGNHWTARTNTFPFHSLSSLTHRDCLAQLNTCLGQWWMCGMRCHCRRAIGVRHKSKSNAISSGVFLPPSCEGWKRSRLPG
jgi:hypothetical protein